MKCERLDGGDSLDITWEPEETRIVLTAAIDDHGNTSLDGDLIARFLDGRTPEDQIAEVRVNPVELREIYTRVQQYADDLAEEDLDALRVTGHLREQHAVLCRTTKHFAGEIGDVIVKYGALSLIEDCELLLGKQPEEW